MKTLIFGTSYVHGAAAAEVFRMWADMTSKKNPNTDVLVVDSDSPNKVYAEIVNRILFRWALFKLNIGHLSRGGGDGWGRAFCYGLRRAIELDYDWVVHIECDLLFARPVAEVIAKMAANGVRAAAPMAMPYQFIETALSFWNVAYLKEVDLIGRYDWRHPPANGILPEQRIGQICAGELFALPLRGLRNDMGMNAQQLQQSFPTGIDWITHAELPVLRKFVEMNDV